jgi:hypothetical protein
MKIKKNTFSTLVLELFFPSIANCRKLKIKNRLPLLEILVTKLAAAVFLKIQTGIVRDGRTCYALYCILYS